MEMIRKFAFWILDLTNQGHTAPMVIRKISSVNGITTLRIQNGEIYNPSELVDYKIIVDEGVFANWLVGHSK